MPTHLRKMFILTGRLARTAPAGAAGRGVSSWLVTGVISDFLEDESRGDALKQERAEEKSTKVALSTRLITKMAKCRCAMPSIQMHYLF